MHSSTLAALTAASAPLVRLPVDLHWHDAACFECFVRESQVGAHGLLIVDNQWGGSHFYCRSCYDALGLTGGH